MVEHPDSASKVCRGLSYARRFNYVGLDAEWISDASKACAYVLMQTSSPTRWLRLLLKSLGPGIITGAADDDPSGIATYSVAGAQLGTSLLWTALITWPLMAAVQIMCARIGMVTGKGLAGALKRRFPSWLLGGVIVALLAANTINIAADLAGMADAAEMLTGIKSHYFVVGFALLISWATIRLGYQQIANVLIPI